MQRVSQSEEELINEMLYKGEEYYPDYLTVIQHLESYLSVPPEMARAVHNRLLDESLFDKVSNRPYDLIISRKGRKIVKEGGYLLYLEKEEEKERVKAEHERNQRQLTANQVIITQRQKNFFWLGALAGIIGFLLSLFNFIKEYL